jgi:glycosyltransferase involved in cell wall biosynthesis
MTGIAICGPGAGSTHEISTTEPGMADEATNPQMLDARFLRELPPPPPLLTRPSEPKITAIIPTLNEAKNVAAVVSALPSCVAEIIIVDGRSEDRTAEVAFAADPRVRIVLERRKGKGAAMLSGFSAARGDAIVCLDADGSMDPEEVKIFQAVLGAGYDLVKGSREAVGGGSDDFSPLRRFGNYGLTRLANAIHRTRWSDMCYGYFGFWRDVLPSVHLNWDELTTRAVEHQLTAEGTNLGRQRAARTDGKLHYGDGFEIETALFLRAARAHLSIAEVPSREMERQSGESNLNTMRDGWRVLSAIGRERQRRKAILRPPAAPTGLA